MITKEEKIFLDNLSDGVFMFFESNWHVIDVHFNYSSSYRIENITDTNVIAIDLERSVMLGL